MTIKKAWMSSGTGTYQLRVLGGSAAIVLLSVLLIMGGTLLADYVNWPREVFFLALCAGVIAVELGLALRLGRALVGNASVFLLTEDDRLYAMDARRLVNHGHHVPDYVAGTMETQRFLNRLERMPYVPAGADEIRKVERIKNNRTHYALRCRVRHPNGHVIGRTYFLGKNIPDRELLLRELERRKSWENELEKQENRNPLCIAVSTLVLAGFAALCVLSHPAVARLPGAIYFPCLGGAFAALWVLLFAVVRQRRGE